jgi:hypothetical protein
VRPPLTRLADQREALVPSPPSPARGEGRRRASGIVKHEAD